ncbi:hypothetical protein AX16_008083 [Volvariella volvacea WC 439]|nr:hypothetical protein AX16_008083 [Volvariella volvacea WC 439]
MHTTPLSHEETLKKFRQHLFSEGILHEGDSIGTDDETLTRFLRARKYDIKQATKMISECQDWRKNVEGMGIDELYKRIDPFDYPERQAVFECWPMWFHKTDKKGRPLNIHFFGGMDIHKLYKSCTPERHWQTVLVNCESLTREILPAASRKAGKPVGTVFVIVDLKGFSVGQFWQMKSLAQKAFQISQDYYPETMGQLAIVNAPPAFTFIWSVIKAWLSKETVAKVNILGHDYKDVLLELVDADSLPSTLGGSCTCSEEGGCHMSGAGPWLEGRRGWGPKAAEARALEEESVTEVSSSSNSTVGNDLVFSSEKVTEKVVANGLTLTGLGPSTTTTTINSVGLTHTSTSVSYTRIEATTSM